MAIKNIDMTKVLSEKRGKEMCNIVHSSLGKKDKKGISCSKINCYISYNVNVIIIKLISIEVFQC